MRSAVQLAGLFVSAIMLSAAPVAAEEKAADADRKICKRDQHSVGTRLGGRICLTAKQWKERDAYLRERKDRLLDRADRESQSGDMFSSKPVG